jgi:long-subunit fatty acid transport protein
MREKGGVAALIGLLGTGLAGPAWAGGLFVYEMATPDLGTASAGRAAAADNAATAFGNPAGMARLDQTQMLAGIQPAYGISHFDKGNNTTVSGGNGGNALGGRYKFAPDWLWSLGVAFDTSPMKKSQRTPALPLDQQVRVGTGVQYALNERMTIGAAYEYLNLGEADIDRERGPLASRATIRPTKSTSSTRR